MYGLSAANSRYFCTDHLVFFKEALLRKFERYALIPARGDRVERLIVSLRPRMPGRCMIPDVYGKTGLNAAVHPKYDFRWNILSLKPEMRSHWVGRETASRTPRLDSKRTCPWDRTPGRQHDIRTAKPQKQRRRSSRPVVSKVEQPSHVSATQSAH